jgi:hypothetical protein
VLSSTLHRRLIALLALCSLLGGAVLPAWAHALTVKRGALLSIEVCTAEGLRVIAPDVSAPGDAPVSGTAADHLKHCPFCAHTMGAPGMPPSPLAWTATPLRLDPPALFLHAPRTLYPWQLAQPRAPPPFS